MMIAMHLSCRLLTPKLSPTQVVLAHPPHRFSPSSGERLPLLFVTGYNRFASAFFKLHTGTPDILWHNRNTSYI